MVYMNQPMGFRDPLHPDYVCLLKKSLYGVLGISALLIMLLQLVSLTLKVTHLCLFIKRGLIWHIFYYTLMTSF